MHSINEATIEQIERLNDIQLSQLLHKLLYSEALKLGLENYDIIVPLKINVADGGEDGRIEWTENKSNNWLKKSPSLFQNKATIMGPQKCYDEIIEPKSKTQKKLKLKSQISDLIKKKGCYTLFTNISLNPSQISKRIQSFNQAITDCNKNPKNVKIEIYDSNRIKDWVNENIAAITYVQECIGITRVNGFKTWAEWQEVWSDAKIPYKTDSKIKSYIEQIRESILKEKVLRIIGHSGLGKTRLVFEAFRVDSPSSHLKSLNSQVVYFDLGKNGTLPNVLNYISSHRKQSGIIIIDNCDDDSHKALRGIVKASGSMCIITIDFSTQTDDPSFIKLDRHDQKEIVKKIVDELFIKLLTQSELDYLTEKAEGYPQMVILFQEAIAKKGGKSILQEIPEDFLKKLVFGRHPVNELEYDIIKSCSIFSSFGFLDDKIYSVTTPKEQEPLKEQMDYIRNNICEGSVSEKSFYRTCLKFRETNIIEQRGRHLMVKPTPLAMSLAAQWWRETPPDQIKTILAELQGKDLGLKLVERLSELDQLDKAKQIVNDLWGINSPFGTAEVLNTELGSLLFRNIVDVNPIASAETLYFLYGSLSKESLFQVDKGRRNLVWALEKLCFRKETFKKAALVLYNFAVAENETWGNNSTNQFKQLFQIFLPGTEVDFNERLSVIEYGLEKQDDDFTTIAIQALGHGLTTHYFTRMGGAEKQGGSTILSDYRPHNPKEVYQYRENILNTFLNIIKDNPSRSSEIKEIVSHSIRTIFSQGQEVLISNFITNILELDKNLWLSAINALKSTLYFEKHISEPAKKTADDLIELLTPSDLENQFILKVSKPEWDSYDKDENGHFIDKPKINAESFAEYLVKNNIEWESYIPNLLKGEQRQSFTFGVKICQLSNNKLELILKSLDIFYTIPENDQNIEFIGGLIWAIRNETEREEILNILLSEKYFGKHTFYLIKMIEPTFIDLQRFLQLVEKEKLSVKYFKSFEYGRPFEKLTPDELINLSELILRLDQKSSWIILSIIYMYCYSSTEKWKACKKYLSNLLSDNNFLIVRENIDTMDGYHWSESVKAILKEHDHKSFAVSIATQIVQLCKSNKDKYSFDHEIREILPNLFTNYFDEVWDILGEGLLGDSLTYIKMKFILESKNGNFHEEGGFQYIPEKDYEKIISWCRKHLPKAALRVAYLMPVSDIENNKVNWHKFSKRMIDEFGEIEGFLNELSANIGSFGFSGSVIPYYEENLALFELLTTHQKIEVRQWAEKMIEQTKKIILREKIDEEDRY